MQAVLGRQWGSGAAVLQPQWFAASSSPGVRSTLYAPFRRRTVAMDTISNPAFSPKAPGENYLLAFDFARVTSSTLSNPVVTVAHHDGTADPAPEALLSGAPTTSGSKVLQRVDGGLAGADYVLTAEVDTPDGSHYILAGVLPVREP